tara:strand:+ start:18094 stop:18633 length:540 start_codon:yes stop_codon:yes gene_type:complete
MQNLPSNYNLLSPTAYKFDIDRLPLVSYWCQNVMLPGVQLGEAMQQTPFRPLPQPGQNVTFDIFDCMFLVDEDMENWNEIYKWVRQLSNPTDPTKEFATLPDSTTNKSTIGTSNVKEMYSNARLHIMTNSMNANKVIEFDNIFPTVITPITLESTDVSAQPIMATVSFVFHDMKLAISV